MDWMRRVLLGSVMCACLLLGETILGAEFPSRATARDIPRLLAATALVRGMDEEALVRFVPEQSGLNFVGCPNCNGGRQEDQLAWSPDQPDEVFCRYCKHRYPSQKYPATEAVTVHTPRGEVVRFPYWANDKGYRYFFQARRDDLVREYLADCTQDLAELALVTKDKSHARRAALLLDRFAQVFPSWCYHYDYPFQQKEIYDGEVPPEKFRSGYRTARWTWWAYKDIPQPLVRAYDWLRDTTAFQELSAERGVDVAARIEKDLLRRAGDQVLANPESMSNMSPTAWRSLIELGRVLREPRYVHEPARRLGQMIDTQFFYDGAWSEGSPDYASQTIGGLEIVVSLLQGYSDPPGYKDPQDGSRFDKLDLAKMYPGLEQARATLRKMKLPNGRAVPVHDTWPTGRRRGSGSTESYLLPALGHACLSDGSADTQTQFHLTWSGGYGHEHADNLSLLLFSRGREMLSDLGYTHTAYRAWMLATVAHNTVVIDGKSQAFGSKRAPSDGSLRFFDARNSRTQVVSADGTRGYPGLAETYRRTLLVVEAGEGQRYAVDLFEVVGGRTHDYFLHGDADDTATLMTPLSLSALDTLLPDGFNWQPTRNEGETRRAGERHYAYGFLKNLRAAPLQPDTPVPVEFRVASKSNYGVRVSLIPESGSRLVVGENPSIRRANEDDSQLEKFNRPFLMLRHDTSDGRSKFVAVLEPLGKVPFITSVERIAVPSGAVVLRVVVGERTDLIAIGAGEPVTVPAGREPATFQGDVGVMSIRGDAVEHAYAIGEGGWTRGKYRLASTGPRSAGLHSVEGDTLVLANAGEPLPEVGDIVRMTTKDGWVYPYSVAAVELKGDALRLRVGEGPGFQFDRAQQHLRFTSFPQREHNGAVKVEWNPRAVR